MSCTSNNATPPSPAIAPGIENIDPYAVAREVGRVGVDPRLRAIFPTMDAPFFQAGLAGYSDAAMRIIARKHGCPLCITEALLDRTLIAGGRGFTKADLGELHENIPGGPEDHPLVCQIMGSDPREMAASALKVAEQGRRGDKAYRMIAYKDFSPEELDEIADQHLRLPGGRQLGPLAVLNARDDEHEDDTPSVPMTFEAIDVNLACPVKKIKAKARGGHWLAQPEGAIQILRAVREMVPKEIPCSVKLRRSFDDTPEMVESFERIFTAAYEMGYAFTTVHARTVEQKYQGPSRWAVLKDLVARNPGKLIFGSGDIWEVEDIFRMIGYTGVSGVSVARGCIGNPWIFQQARQMMRGERPAKPTIQEQREVLEEHFRLAVRVSGEDLASRTMRKFAIRFSQHHPEAEPVRLRFIAIKGTQDWVDVLDEWYAPGRIR